MVNQKTLTAETVARVRSGVVAALSVAVAESDKASFEKIPKGRYSVVLAGPKGLQRYLNFHHGRVQERENKGLGSVILRFPSFQDMATKLGGGSGTLIPIPLSPSFLKAAQAFQTLSSRGGELCARREFSTEEEQRQTLDMLMTAALRGVAETAMIDSWTAAKSASMSHGIVQVQTQNGSVQGWLKRDGKVFSSGRGAAPAPANARLCFSDESVGLGVFTGTLPALKALGRGHVSIRGRVPMIQALFPLLDRFGQIMAWNKES
ncbi:MAG: hypothetical protein MI717_14035 [Spirochaetales bacterium]|nr:hypothetical protein [Spirochaetales bacterium]